MQISSLGTNNHEPEKTNLKKYVLIALIASVVLLVIVLICIVLFSNMKPKTLTLLVDGQAKEFSQDTFIIDNNNNIYVSLKDIASLIGYRYYNGGYQQFTEDNTMCYLECSDEVVTYELKSYNMYKTPNDGEIQYSEFTMTEPVKRSNDKLYVISTGLAVGCNVSFSYNKDTMQITINTLPGLYKAYNDKIIAGDYTDVNNLSEVFTNKKAILYGMLVVGSANKYGVISVDGSKTYIGTKYDEMEFVENSQEFFVKVKEKYGVITKDGETKIGIDYDKVSLLDNVNNLYYVENNGYKGVLNRRGRILGNLYVEYNEIGVNTALFPSNDIKNSKLLYDNCIPVKKGDKWGMFDVTGSQISNFNWDSLGYIDSTANGKRSKNILLVEYGNISGIVVSKDGKYGMINAVGELLIPCVFDKIYSEISAGEEIYYMEFEGKTTELVTYLKDKGIKVEETNKDDNGMIDLNATPTPNLDLETPNIIQKTPSPSPVPSPTDDNLTEIET